MECAPLSLGNLQVARLHQTRWKFVPAGRQAPRRHWLWLINRRVQHGPAVRREGHVDQHDGRLCGPKTLGEGLSTRQQLLAADGCEGSAKNALLQVDQDE